MRSSILISLAASAVTSVQGYQPASTNPTDALAAKALRDLTSFANLNNPSSACNSNNIARRREWGDLSGAERIEYTNAVKCLMNKPSRLNPVEVPGAKTRYDDFVAVHINQTTFIHGTANFLSWHRYLVWAYEQALRNECNYSGYQPYWNWGKYAHDPVNSPIFDGSATSMGGNGAYYPHNCTDPFGNGLKCIPPGDGGGCVQTGPFANMTVNLGLLSVVLRADNIAANWTEGFFGHKPRCLRRDVSQWVSSQWTRDKDTLELLTKYNTIEGFQDRMQGLNANVTGFWGVHTGGHYTIGGDPAGDFFASNGDPAFYLHHAQIDRVWWIWQNLQPQTRTNAIGGTITIFNDPPSRDGTLQDILDMGILNDYTGGPRPISQLMSSVGQSGSPLCYVYV